MGRIKSVHWDFRRELPLRKDAMEYSSSAAFQGSGRVTAGKGEAAVAPKSPDLKIITDASDTGVIGIDAPVLSWTDMSASAVQSWSIYRVVSGEKIATSLGWELSAVHAQGAHGPDAQTLEPGVGTLLTAKLGVPGKLHARLSPAPKGGFTAPVTPVLVQMVNKQPGDVTNPSATWDAKTDVTWPKAVWTGQYSDAAAAATRYTLKRGGSVLADRTTDLQVVDNGAPRGVQSTWTLVADAGPGLPGAPEAKGLLAWPSAPSCVAQTVYRQVLLKNV